MKKYANIWTDNSQQIANKLIKMLNMMSSEEHKQTG